MGWTPGPGPTSGNDTYNGDGTNEVVSGGDGDDTLNGAGGNDTLNGDDGNDTLTGGAGADIINGGAGNDIIAWVFGDGADTVDGGADTDTLNLTDGASANILNASFNGASLSNVAGITVTNVENVNVDMGGGIDWLIYSAASAAVTVNLATGAASGFTSVANIERVIGGNNDDTITGNGSDNRLDGGVGSDTLAGGGGIDTLIGGDGNDTISGGLGNDSIQGGNGNDTINWAVGDGRDTIDGGANTDTFNVTGTASAELGNATWNGATLTALMDNGLSNLEAVNLDLGGGVDWLIYAAGSAAVTVNLGANAASGFASVTNIEKVIGGGGGDTLTGDALDNRLDGQAGNDILDGGAGSDTVLGGDGNDTIYASAGNDSLQGLNGNDTFIWTSTDGRDTFSGGADFDTVNMTGSAAADVADANWNGSVITGLLNNALLDIEAINMDLGAGGSGGDWLRYNTTFGISVNLANGTGSGFASITGVENLIGGTGNDTLTGDAGVNKINGNSGDDIITGGLGADILTGLAGNDTFNWTWGDGGDVADGGGDTDTFNFTGNTGQNFFSVQYNGTAVTSAAGVSLTSIESVNADMGGGEDWLSYTATAAVIANLLTGAASGFTSIAGFENVIGGNGNDTITGDAGANKLQGGAGNDTIDGGAGNDTIEGGAGDDTIDGGADTDTLTYAAALAGVTVDLQITTGQDTVGAGTDTIANIENLTGSAHNDTLTGNASANVLVGGAGADTMTGGDGNDTYYVDNVGDVVAESGSGVDSVYSSVDFSLAGYNAENLYLSGSALNGTGNASANIIVGNDNNNVLTGGGGIDALYGMGGDDVLKLYGSFGITVSVIDGGDGTDTLYLDAGGSGSAQIFNTWTIASIEHLSFTAFNSYYYFAPGQLPSNLSLDATNEGSHYVNIIVAPRTTAGAVNIDMSGWTFTDWNGNIYISGDGFISPDSSSADTISGTSQRDYIYGNGGADTLSGNGGNDNIYGGTGTDIINGGDGDDYIDGGDGADTIHGGNGNDTIVGQGGGVDTLYGDAGNDSLTGGEAADLLDGGTGADAMNGWNGDDTYYVDNAGDTITDNSGIDTVYASVSYSLATNDADNLYLSGSALNGTGNTLANIIVGNDNNNVLDGAGGLDTLSGMGGDDLLKLYGPIGNGSVGSIDGGSGTDTLYLDSSGSGVYQFFDDWTITSIEHLSFTAFDSSYVFAPGQLPSDLSLDATNEGSHYVNIIIAPTTDSGAVNIDLSGWTFTDWNGWITLSGGYFVGDSGNADTLSGSSQRDNIYGYGGADTINGNGGDDFIMAGDGNDIVAGGAGNDTILGGDGNDTIDGGDGNDNLDGGNGTDTLTYASASAGITISFALFGSAQNTGGAGNDTIDNFENLIGSAYDDTLSGNGNPGTIDGGAGIDTISYAGVGDYVTVSLALQGSAQDTYAGGMDTLLNFENLIGTVHNDTLGGDANNNVIDGSGGADVITGAGGNDTLTGGSGADIFVYATGAGTDTITDFDADASGGQDLMNITGFGITAGDFGSRVTITDLGSDTQITIDGTVVITLTGVTGDVDNLITQSDFMLAS